MPGPSLSTDVPRYGLDQRNSSTHGAFVRKVYSYIRKHHVRWLAGIKCQPPQPWSVPNVDLTTFLTHTPPARNLSAIMKSFAAVSALLLSLSSAVSAWTCLSDDDAQYIVNQSIIFLQHTDVDQARAIAYDLFAPDLMEYGDSINALRGDPVCLFLCTLAYTMPCLSSQSFFWTRVASTSHRLPRHIALLSLAKFPLSSERQSTQTPPPTSSRLCPPQDPRRSINSLSCTTAPRSSFSTNFSASVAPQANVFTA